MATLTVTNAQFDFRGQAVADVSEIIFATSGSVGAIFDSSQFSPGNISNTVAIVGNASTNSILVHLGAAGEVFSAAGWAFGNWSTGDFVSLQGSAGNDTITGSSQADVLNGNAGADTVQGGAGNDTYVVDDAADIVIESNVAGSVDLVQSSVSFDVSGQSIENLTLTGSDAIDGTGNDLANTLIGNTGANILFGLGGNDTLDGLAGADRMEGGTGNDTYFVDNTSDQVIEVDGADVDTVIIRASFSIAGTAVENLNVAGGNNVVATGNNLDNVMNSGSGNDVLKGAGGNDVLDANGGTDTLEGGTGNDTYFINSPGDIVTEFDGEGIDTINTTVSYSLVGIFAENLIGSQGNKSVNLTGNDLDNILVGGGQNDTLIGGGGSDRMEGDGGDDFYIVDDAGDSVVEASGGGTDSVLSSVTYSVADQAVENLTLTGSAAIDATGNDLNNTLIGNAGANTLNGGAGADSMDGGDGNDTYVVDNAGDVVAELANGGVDTVQSFVSFTLGAGLENLTLLGGGDINGTGNDLNNTLIGNSGANTLDGGAGADTMEGGGGNDTYVVDNAGDKTIEANITGSIDTVLSSVSFSVASQFVENLTLTGSADIDATGNSLDNVLTGNAGVNILTGALGNDTYFVNNIGDQVIEANVAGSVDTVNSSVTFSIAAQFVENLTLTGSGNIDAIGNSLANTLTGNGAANLLNGAGAADTMTGLGGNDTYVVDNAADKTIEANVPGSIDTVNSSVSFSIASQFVENLTLTGSADIDATGNNLNNVLTGNAGDNTLTGALGNDTYVVNNVGDRVVEANVAGSVDTVNSSVTFSIASQFVENLTLTGSADIDATGNNLNNVLTGNAGDNTLTGALGNDTYVVNDVGDQVVEANVAGDIDLVRSSVDFSIASQFVENLTLTGGAAIDGTGNSLDNVLLGNTGRNTLIGAGGNDRLDGGSGADTMEGGAGNDTYVVDHVGDKTVEPDVNEGVDTVYSSVTFSIASQFVDNLTLTGSADIDVTGNSLSNVLIGNSGDNRLDGESGPHDIMSGGGGNDTYSVNSSGDEVIEANISGSIDLVLGYTNVNVADQFVENVTLFGGREVRLNATGNSLDNVLTGSQGPNALIAAGGADWLDGDTGNDSLSGGADADTFVFDDDDGFDTVEDFENGSDTFDLTAVTAIDDFSDLTIDGDGVGVTVRYGSDSFNAFNIANIEDTALLDASDFIFA